MNTVRSAAGLVVGIVLAVAGPAAAENVLRWGNADDGYTTDPYSFDDLHVDEIWQQICEPLVGLDSNMQIVDLLATAWQPLDTTTWKFELRPGVRFHDDTPFTAEDVVFSIRRAHSETSAFKGDLAHITDVVAIDAHTVRITTAHPDALLWATLAKIKILSKAWAERHGTTRPANFAAGEQPDALEIGNCTGPFMLREFDRTGRIVMVRNPDWWGLERYPHNIDRIERIMLDDTAQGVDLLLKGQIDFLQELPYQWLDQLQRAPGVKVVQTPWLITAFLALDQGSNELRSSNVKDSNPFKDKRVRQALYHAIDIEGLIAGVLDGLARPAGMLIPPGVNGYTPELATRPPYDPERARALLTEAGYPGGFRVTLDCANSWSLLRGEKVCRALAAQLGAIGIEMTVDFQPSGPFMEKYRSGGSDLYVEGTSGMFDSQRNLDLLLHSRGLGNFTGYANSKVDELIDQARYEMVTYARDPLVEKAWRIVNDDVAYIPLYHPMVVWAMRDDLDLPADPWWRPRFRLARFKETGG